MTNCWNLITEERPLFDEIARNLSAILGTDEEIFIEESGCEDLGYVRDVTLNGIHNGQAGLNAEEYELLPR